MKLFVGDTRICSNCGEQRYKQTHTGDAMRSFMLLFDVNQMLTTLWQGINE
jgi:hypothetical protein